MKIPRLRWVIAGLLAAATLLNYLDRQALGIVSVDIRREFHLSEEDYSQVIALFFVAYAIMYAGSGFLIDRLGTRRGFAVFIFGWSGAQLLHGLATGKWSLSFYRFLLGFCEPGAWPAAAKAINEWFGATERALVMGIFNGGTSLGSALAPVVVGWLAIDYGWRSAFLFTGIAGFAWLTLWLLLYQPPALNRFLRRAEYDEFRADVAPAAQTTPAPGRSWWALVRTRGCATLILTRFFTDPVSYFVIFWLPEYLRKERGFDLAMVRDYAWIPFALAGIAHVFGGWLSGRLMRSGWTLPRARKFVMALGAACVPAAIAAPLVPTAAMALAAASFMTVGHALWVANQQTLATDLYQGHEIGTVTGASGSGGAIGGVLAQLGTGYVVTHISYAPIFLLAGLMHPLSAVLTYRLLPDRYFASARGSPGPRG